MTTFKGADVEPNYEGGGMILVEMVMESWFMMQTRMGIMLLVMDQKFDNLENLLALKIPEGGGTVEWNMNLSLIAKKSTKWFHFWKNVENLLHENMLMLTDNWTILWRYALAGRFNWAFSYYCCYSI